ncbi:MAG: phosphonoacetaldehyde reductase [Pseudobutyrivibrio sp.]|nr:phosphonoacetaldehyde reductase [Pseudobutyrivibrio sp.]
MKTQSEYKLNKDEYDLIGNCIEGSKVFLVCGNSARASTLTDYISKRFETFIFSEFTSNPKYEEVINGSKKFKGFNPDTLIAVGGGSAIDVAKCILVFDEDRIIHESDFSLKELKPVKKFIAVPTTAGTGSEATRFAVIYRNGEKTSVESEYCLPDDVFFISSMLDTLGEYQRKCTMLDAFSHAIESWWCVNATDESREYALKAIKLFFEAKDDYLNNVTSGNSVMLEASNYAGKAINITKTTAAHAMAYKLTTLFGYAHGHAVGLCLKSLWKYHLEKGLQTLVDLAEELEYESAESMYEDYVKIFNELQLEHPNIRDAQLIQLVNTVNVDRLKNNPISLDKNSIDGLYREISMKY